MSIKKTLQCEKCLAHKETTEAAISFAQPRAWQLSLGIVFFILGGAGLGAIFGIVGKFGGEVNKALFIAPIIVNAIFGTLGLIFLILYIVKKVTNSRLYRCPKCGHRMVPVYHHHRT